MSDISTFSSRSQQLEEIAHLSRLSLQKFMQWFNKNGSYSYDPYDLWATEFGIWAKQQYQAHSVVGVPLIAPIILGDIFLPRLSRKWSKKHYFPIAEAHCIDMLLNIANSNENTIAERNALLQNAESHAERLISLSLQSTQYSGHCWGYPFNWQTNQGVWNSGTPLITTTPYCYRAFCHLADVTQKQEYNDYALSVAEFAMKDIQDTKLTSTIWACSYSPIDSTQVVNANAYRAALLFDAAKRFSRNDFRTVATKNLEFVLTSQREDGSWLYALSSKRDHFIDNFHTCLVLKNLHAIYAITNDDRIRQSIVHGYDYYHRNLLYANGSPKPFVLLPRTNIVEMEGYDIAEGLFLSWTMRVLHPNALENTQRLLKILTTKYQTNQGYFVTKVYKGGIKNTMPYIRWAQAQTAHALSLTAQFGK